LDPLHSSSSERSGLHFAKLNYPPSVNLDELKAFVIGRGLARQPFFLIE